jgi:hypothetical protein
VQQKHVFHAAKPIIYSCAKACACIQHIVLPLKHFPTLFLYRLSTQCFQSSQCFPNAHMHVYCRQCFSKVKVQLHVAPMAAAIALGASKCSHVASVGPAVCCSKWHWCFQSNQCFPNVHMCTTCMACHNVMPLQISLLKMCHLLLDSQTNLPLCCHGPKSAEVHRQCQG